MNSCLHCGKYFEGRCRQKFCSQECYHAHDLPESVREKLRSSHVGKVMGPSSTETRFKIAEANKGKEPWNKGKILDSSLYASRSGNMHHLYVPARDAYEDELRVRRRWRGILNQVRGRIGTSKQELMDVRIGYSAGDLKRHLEMMFEAWMTWENYGEWQIDHVKNVVEFLPSECAAVVNSLSNLRPLKKIENQSREKSFTRKLR